MFKHPIDSIGNLLKVIYIVGVGSQFPFTEEHKIYIKMIEQICSKVCEKCKKFWDGDSVVRTRMSGKLVGEFLAFLVSTKGIDKATKIIKSANATGKLNEVLSKISETTKFDNIVKSLEGAEEVSTAIKNFRKFKNDEAIIHFEKHSKEMMDAFGKKSYNLMEYINDANYVIEQGKYVPELNGYVRLIGGKGKAKYGFVGLDRKTGNITTFHIKTASELSKKAPSLGIIK